MPHPCPPPVDDLLHPRDVLTPRQAEVFYYLFESTRRTGIQPSARDLCKVFGFKSVRSSDLYVKVLARKGWIAHPRGATVVRALRFLRTPGGTPFRGFILPGTMEPDPLACADHGDPALRGLTESAVVIILALRSLRRDPKDPRADADLMCARRDWDAQLSSLVAGLPPAYEPDGKAPVKI
jgi:hypothetical protein